MNTSYLGEGTDIILGQEFLTWLWYKSDTAPTSFTDKKNVPFSVSMEQRIVVQGGEGDNLETASVSGSLSPLREARLGLVTGKKVTRAIVRLEQNDLDWQLSLRAEDLSCNSLRTPKIEKEAEDDDPDAFLLEKIYLMELCVGLVDALYAQFLELRLSNEWASEVRNLQSWMSSN